MIRNFLHRGLVYAQAKCEPGWVVFVQGKLLHISKDYVCSVVDQTTLKVCMCMYVRVHVHVCTCACACMYVCMCMYA